MAYKEFQVEVFPSVDTLTSRNSISSLLTSERRDQIWFTFNFSGTHDLKRIIQYDAAWCSFLVAVLLSYK